MSTLKTKFWLDPKPIIAPHRKLHWMKAGARLAVQMDCLFHQKAVLTNQNFFKSQVSTPPFLMEDKAKFADQVCLTTPFQKKKK
jgi:hypothetical protein